MLQAIEDFFFPTERNKMVPWSLTRSAFVLYLGIALVLSLAPRYATISELALLAQPASFSGKDVIGLVNTARTAAGLPALRENSKLDEAASAKLDDMLEGQYFAHVSPAAKTPWDFFRAQDYVYLAAGENLAMDFVSANDTHAALMNSPTHRANILNKAYTEIGVAVGQGTFGGHTSILIAQYFGKPASAKIALAPSEVAKQPTPPQAPAPMPVVASAQETAPKAEAGSETASAPTEVLGAESNPAATAARVGMRDMLREVPEGAWIRVLIAVFAALFLLPLIFVLLRVGTVPYGAALQVAALCIIFGAIFFFGSPNVSVERLTPAAANTVAPLISGR